MFYTFRPIRVCAGTYLYYNRKYPKANMGADSLKPGFYNLLGTQYTFSFLDILQGKMSNCSG